MPIICFKYKSFRIDEDGYLLKFEDWCLEFVEFWVEESCRLPADKKYIAEVNNDGSLTGEHHKIINDSRKYYEKEGVVPLRQVIGKVVRMPLKRIFELFPLGPQLGVYKLAGIPKCKALR